MQKEAGLNAPELITRFIPSLHTVAQVAPLALVTAGVVGVFVAALQRRGVRTAYTRKIFHFTIFTTASIVQLIWQLPGVVVFGSVLALVVLWAVWRGDGNGLYEAMARPSDSPRRTLFILIPLLTTAAGGGISNLLFPSYAYIGYLVCGWGDAVGEPVGSRFGRHRYNVPSLGGVPSTRSYEGSAAVFIVGSTAALFGLLAAGLAFAYALPIAFLAGLAGALVEAISNHGLDNLTVQVAGAAAATAAAAFLLP